MKHRISKLAFKLTIGFVILGILICGISSFIGYNQYKNSIEKQYNATAYDIAETAFSYFKNGELAQYAELAEGYKNGTVSEEEIKAALESDRYKEISSAFDSLREAMGANDVLAFVLDKEELQSYNGDRKNWNPLLYMFDSYTVPEYSYELGDSGSFNPDYINELADIKDTGCISSSYFVSKGDYGYNTAGILPVTNHDGVFAMISVEIPMTTLKSSLQQYILNAILVTVAVIIVVIAVYMIYLFRRVIKPINTIASEAGNFTSNGNRISEALAGINTKDEIESLAGSILKMETDINEYIENLTKVTAEKERIGAELDVARHIQSSMLPCIFPAFPERDEFEVYATMTPAKEVGGDFYDFFMVDERHLAIVMADVSGKGVPAALFMVIGKTLIKDHTQPGRNLGEVFSEVNDRSFSLTLCHLLFQLFILLLYKKQLWFIVSFFIEKRSGYEAVFKTGYNRSSQHFELSDILIVCRYGFELIVKDFRKLLLVCLCFGKNMKSCRNNRIIRGNAEIAYIRCFLRGPAHRIIH